MSRGLFDDQSAPAFFAHVAIERSVDLPEGLTYAVPASMADLRVGERVLAPLGSGNRLAPGCVVEINVRPDLAAERIKPIAKRTGLVIPPSLVDLARWISRYYCAPLGVAVSSMLPAPVKRGIGRREVIEIERTGMQPAEKLPPKARAAWEAIESLPEDVFPLAPRALMERIGAETQGPINRLVRLGLLRLVRSQRVHALWQEHAVAPPQDLALTDEQKRAVEGIGATLGGFAVHLLRGVTGSGKTEVYLRVLERVVAQGRGAIVLVPEISLTPQTVGRFLGRFERAGVAVLHSGLTPAQRNQQWTMLAAGEARIVVGARSAVFAPFDRARVPLGLIVVDEEHDSAYKQDQAPRHNARDVAVKRGQIEGCPVVLGSAMPSLESWRNAAQGRYSLHELSIRAAGAALPRVEVVDLAQELRARAQSERRVSLIGPRLEGALRRTLGEGGQAILLLNRRGYANYISCPDHGCGWTMVCDHCDATMVYHKDRRLPLGGFVRCHHCLEEQRLPARCPVCGKNITTFGMGTQRVEEELALRFPELEHGGAMLRLDSDTITSGRQWHDVLERFGRGEVRVLLGTQMIAKGLDFPRVRLVGVISADTSLNLPDFRAAERTFQLVSQVAGRAGRAADGPGRVVVQSFNPETPAIRHAANHDYAAFAAEEMTWRAEAGLPPATRMARVVVRDKDYAKALAAAREVGEALRDAARETAQVRGPMPCPLSRLHGQHRIAVEMTAETPAAIQKAIAAARSAGLLKSDAHTAVDVDPVMLL